MLSVAAGAAAPAAIYCHYWVPLKESATGGGFQGNMERLKSGSLGQCHHSGRLRFVGASVTFVNQKGERNENIINRGSTMGC